MKAFLIDIAKCNGCHNCQIACKDEHCGTSWAPFAAEQPMTGQFWCKVEEKVRGSVPVTRINYVPVLCAHCEDAPCVKVAKNDAVRRLENGLVIIDPELSKGQKAIVDACPIGAVYWNEELEIPQKCTGCAHLLEDGWSVPRCVDACCTGAMQFGDVEDLDLDGAEPLPGVEKCGAKVYYKNLPKRFVAGCVVDFAEREVVIGADIQLIGPEGSVVAEQKTDEFGDFMFDQVEANYYKVMIACEEGLKTFDADATREDVNLGDLSWNK